jgi:hypothetical protein
MFIDWLEGQRDRPTTKWSTIWHLHAKVEPDMQRHPVCRDKKVLNLTGIFEFMVFRWKDPPASHVFMPINRQLLENEVKREKRKNKGTDSIAIGNLKALNRAQDEGLWGGRAKVFEAGAPALMGTKFEQGTIDDGVTLGLLYWGQCQDLYWNGSLEFFTWFAGDSLLQGHDGELQILARWTPPMDTARKRRATGTSAVLIIIKHAGILSYV